MNEMEMKQHGSKWRRMLDHLTDKMMSASSDKLAKSEEMVSHHHWSSVQISWLIGNILKNEMNVGAVAYLARALKVHRGD